jgi:hypothetical protein
MPDKNFWQKIKEEISYAVDPIDRISEVLFGLIMVLTFTGSISVASDGRAEIRELLWAALGCNLAWGIVDAVMYLMSTTLERGHALATFKKLKTIRDKSQSKKLFKDKLPSLFLSILSEDEIDNLKDRVIRLDTLPKTKLLSSAEIRGAILIFILVFTCTFPVALPFIFLQNTAIALRASNGIALLILFAGGFSVGKYSGFSPFLTGALLTFLGIILVAITMALGG